MSDQWNNSGGWGWERYTRPGSRRPPAWRNRPGGPPPWVAALLIAFGVLLFLGNLGWLPVENVWVFWPVFPLAAGVGHLLRAPRYPNAIFWGVFLIIFSVAFLLANLGLAHFHIGDTRFIVPLLLIVFGFLGLMKIVGGGSGRSVPPPPGMPFEQPNPWQSSTAPPGFDFENSVNDFTFFGALKRKLETPSFAGGRLTAVFGDLQIDLRRASISSLNKSAILNTTAVFGAVKIRVPQDWRIHMSGLSVLGNFEDKTIPPNIGPAAAVLIVTGFSLFGTVEIED